MLRIKVLTGDITKEVEVDAIATLINQDGDWYGGVDFAIYKVAGERYHDQAWEVKQKATLTDGQVIVAHGNHTEHNGKFDHVIFVVDYRILPLRDLVHSALTAAKAEGYKSVALPLMRTGIMLGVVEPDLQSTVQAMRDGIEKFEAEGETEMNIFVVAYNDPVGLRLLYELMKPKG